MRVIGVNTLVFPLFGSPIKYSTLSLCPIIQYSDEVFAKESSIGLRQAVLQNIFKLVRYIWCLVIAMFKKRSWRFLSHFLRFDGIFHELSFAYGEALATRNLYEIVIDNHLFPQIHPLGHPCLTMVSSQCSPVPSNDKNFLTVQHFSNVYFANLTFL